MIFEEAEETGDQPLKFLYPEVTNFQTLCVDILFHPYIVHLHWN